MEERSNMGRPRVIKDEHEMKAHYEGYLKDIKENPIEVPKVVKGEVVNVKRFKPPTWKGFEAYLFRAGVGNAQNYVNLDNYRRNVGEKYSDLLGIIRAISADMFDRKFAGAAVEEFNANIIAKELGLMEQHGLTNFQRPVLEGGKELPPDEPNTPRQDPLLD